MKLSERWLREWVNVPVSAEQLAEQLTLRGLEVSSVLPVALSFRGVVVGEVMSATSHPDAHRLTICRVSAGHSTVLEIVCGASNVRSGLKVAVILVGGELAGKTIQPAQLRGITSHGMICSAQELGLAEKSVGILELPPDAPVGMDLHDYLQLDDYSFDIELTPNRGDCLSIVGLAREVAAANGTKVCVPSPSPQFATLSEQVPVVVMVPEACPRYLGRIIRHVNGQASTPIEIRERLRRSGFNTHHPVVDIVNYVMLELGQPLHAFDLERLQGELQVRYARSGESLMLLDDSTVVLTEKTLIIADTQGPQAIAGILGGKDSAISPTTQHVFLESAFFSPGGITLSSRDDGLQTESAYRFARGVDYQLPEIALERATELLLTVMGGEAGPITAVTSVADLPIHPPIILRHQRIQRLLGIVLDGAEVEVILHSLGMVVQKQSVGWSVTPPSFRSDIVLEVDLIEELARCYGYARIPTHRLNNSYAMIAESEAELPITRFKQLLVNRGYHEVVTYSFVDEALQHELDPTVESMVLKNPIASHMTAMRTHLWPGLLQAVQYNQHRQVQRVRLFEVGLCFVKQGNDSCQQTAKIGGIAVGDAHPRQWGEGVRLVDFYDVKGDVMALIGLMHSAEEVRWVPTVQPGFHPGWTAEIYYKNQNIGIVGALHPHWMQRWNLLQTPFIFELRWDAIRTLAPLQYQPISKYPSIQRDIAVVVDHAMPVEVIRQKVVDFAGPLLNKVQIFDIYVGEGIELGKKSVALGLTFQDPSRTLMDDEINSVIDRVVASLAREFNAKLRA